jgi:hypothetical protein
MKIGFNFVGISYEKDKRDWRIEKEAFKKQVIDCWDNSNNKIIKLTTYKQYSTHNNNLNESARWYNPTIDELLDFFKPKDLLLLNVENSSQIKTFLQSLLLWEFEDVDFIVCSRFDIKYNVPVNNNVDLNKINFLFREGKWWTERRYICDNFFIIPKKFLESFTKAMHLHLKKNSWDCINIHPIYNYLLFFLDENNFHFMYNDMNSYSHHNPYYTLLR